jgi:hypothetical protein
VIKPEGARLIPSQYIVKLKETASTESLQDAMTHLGATEANHVYDSENFKGFASQLDAETLEKLQSHPEVRTELAPVSYEDHLVSKDMRLG